MAGDKNIKKGDEVSWQWSGGRPGGKASQVETEGEVQMTTKRGNLMKKKGSPDNPAVRISREGHDVIKRANELDKEADAKENGDGGEDDGKEEEEEKEEKKGKDDKKKPGKREHDQVNGDEGKKAPSKARKTEGKASAPAAKKRGKGTSQRAQAPENGPGTRTRSKKS